MGVCQSRSASSSEPQITRPATVLPVQWHFETLEEVITDAVASEYLLKFAKKELSSVNVEFLLALNRLFHRLDLSRGLGDRSTSGVRNTGNKLRSANSSNDSVGRNTDKESTLSSMRGVLAQTRASMSAALMSGRRSSIATRMRQSRDLIEPTAEEVEEVRSIIDKFFAVSKPLLDLSPKVSNGLLDWYGKKETTTLPINQLASSHDSTLRTVRHDIYPRFKASPMHHEMLLFHPARALRSPKVRAALEPSLTSAQRAALKTWVDATAYADCTDQQQRPELAKSFVIAHASSMRDLGVSTHIVEKMLTECDKAATDGVAPRVEVFRPVQAAVHNFLGGPYIELLLSEGAEQLYGELGVQSCSLKLPDPQLPQVIVEGEEDGYHAGW